jgi:peroxidase/lariat debranching enzyme
MAVCVCSLPKKALKNLLMETTSVPFSARPHLCSFLALVLLYVVSSPCFASLFFNFYGASCPAAELIVSNKVRSASSSDPTIPGKLVRLVFHDCFVEVSLSHLMGA